MTTKAHSLLTGADLHEPKGASSASAGQVYIANGSGSGVWTDSAGTVGLSQFSTGDLKPTMKTLADTGWIMADDGSIGDASSGATTRANADCLALFTLIWTNFANTEAAVSGSRGASAAADFAAHKTIALPKMLGRVYGIAGAGSGLTSRVIGKTLGEETHLQTSGELAAHTHIQDTHQHSIPSVVTKDIAASAGAGTTVWAISGSAPASTANTTATNQTTGSSTPFNVMQPTFFLKMMVKL